MYGITDIITCGLISSLISTLITIIVKYILDTRSASIAYKRELRKQVFKRKTDVVESAMSWYQEVVDMYNIYQLAIQEYDGSANPIVMGKIQYASTQLNRLLQETSSKFNAIYLYYDFTDIEAKYGGAKSAQIINEAFILVSQMQQYMLPLPTINEQELEIRKQWFSQLKQTLDIAASAMDNQKFAIVDIQQRLRTEYQKYMK